MVNDCKWLYADWCHNDYLTARDGQELCPFYFKGFESCECYERVSG
jgi:hypothetical protein